MFMRNSCMAKRASSDGAMGLLATVPSCMVSRKCVSMRVDATSESEDVDSDDQVGGGVNAMWGSRSSSGSALSAAGIAVNETRDEF